MAAERRLRVLPDAARVEDAMVQAARAGSGFVDGSGWMTFGQLVDALGGVRSAGRRPCSPLTSRLLVLAATKRLGGGPFGAWANEPAFARGAVELFAQLKSGGMGPAAFNEVASHFPAGRIERVRYLAALYLEYEKRLAGSKLADREDGVLLATATLRKSGLPATLAAFSEMRIEWVHDFPVSRRALLLELARQCERLGIGFHLEIPAGGSPHVDAAIDPVLGEFERAAQGASHVEVGKRDPISDTARPLAFLGRHLFGEGVPADLPKPLPLEMIRAATARQETRVLARVAAEKVAAGVPPDRIAIAWPDLGDEAEWTVDALAELGIPARMRRGLPLAATGVGRIAFDLPLIADDGFPAARVAALLSSRYAPKFSRSRDDSFAPAALFAEAGVRDDLLGAESGRGAYHVRLSSLVRRLQTADHAGRLNEARRVLDQTRSLISIVGAIPEEGRTLELLERWWDALGEIGLPDAVKAPDGRGIDGSSLDRAVLGALARDQSAFEALQTMVSEFQAALRDTGAAAARMQRRTFQRWLLDAAQDFNLVARGARGGAVQVLDVRELAGRTFEQVYLGGLADGRFPSREGPRPVFPDEDRALVNQSSGREVFRLLTGEGPQRIARGLAADRLSFYLALSSASGGVTVSVAAESATGAESTPSPFWDELLRITGALERAAPLRPVPPLDEVRSEQEFRERIALEAFAPAALRTEDPDPAASALLDRARGESWLNEARTLADIETERLRFFSEPERPPGPFSGNAARDDLRSGISDCFAFGPEHPLSASKLDHLGNCAFQGFLEQALKLSEPEAPGEELDSRQRGSFWHKAMEVLVPRLKAAGLLGGDPNRIPDAMIDEAVDEAARDLEQNGPTGHRALWRVGQARAQRMVRNLLGSRDRGLPIEDVEPDKTELEFGLDESPEAWRRVSIPGLHGEAPVFVRGKIDRLDVGPKRAAIVDYKSAKTLKSGAQLREVLLKSNFQIPLYLHAARAAGISVELDGAWLSMKTGESVRLSEQIEPEGVTIEQLISTDPAVRAELAERGALNLANAVHRVVTSLREGKFPARPIDCQYCGYRRVCRISERLLPEAERQA